MLQQLTEGHVSRWLSVCDIPNSWWRNKTRALDIHTIRAIFPEPRNYCNILFPKKQYYGGQNVKI